jgi:hypothetical protein
VRIDVRIDVWLWRVDVRIDVWLWQYVYRDDYRNIWTWSVGPWVSHEEWSLCVCQRKEFLDHVGLCCIGGPVKRVQVRQETSHYFLVDGIKPLVELVQVGNNVCGGENISVLCPFPSLNLVPDVEEWVCECPADPRALQPERGSGRRLGWRQSRSPPVLLLASKAEKD